MQLTKFKENINIILLIFYITFLVVFLYAANTYAYRDLLQYILVILVLIICILITIKEIRDKAKKKKLQA